MQRQLVSTNVYIFIIVLIIAIILGIIYQVLAVDRPTDLQTFNKLNPFPSIKMEHVPPPEFTYKNPNIKDCSVQILPCSDDNGCKDCGLNYTCTPVDASENLVVNGNRIGTGSWCLPKNKLSGCGKYTGQVVWSGNELGEGEWACVCKYPSLFTGETCLENKACKDTSIIAGNINQDNNNLVNSQGEVYNPNLPNFYPPNSEANPYARENVYDKDGKLKNDVLGKPVYSCSCGTSGGKTFVSLPNNPQGCNLDPCTPSHSSPLWNEQNQTCICGINGVVKSDGTCIESSCAYGTFNPLTGMCECMGRLGLMRCHTDNIGWGVPTPKCDDPENKTGLQCIDRCIYKYCTEDDINNCGGEAGYRPDFFDNQNSTVCIGGTCNFSDDYSEVECECPENTAYDDNPGSGQYGVCLRSGKGEGSRCYMLTEPHIGDVPYLWLEKTDNGHEPHIINYLNNEYTQSVINSANEKCRIRCARSEDFPWGNTDAIREIVNSDNFDPKISCTRIDAYKPAGGGFRVTSPDKTQNYNFAQYVDTGKLPKNLDKIDYYCGILCGPDKD